MTVFFTHLSTLLKSKSFPLKYILNHFVLIIFSTLYKIHLFDVLTNTIICKVLDYNLTVVCYSVLH